MGITDLKFLFIFLPFSLIVYFLSSNKVKGNVLIILNFIFYSIYSVNYIFLFCFEVIITVFLGRRLIKTISTTYRKALLAIGISINIGLLAYYKYSGIIYPDIDRVTNASFNLDNFVLPMGISFFTFKAVSYLIDIYKNKIVLTELLSYDILYLSFFGQVQSGPLTRYNEMKNDSLDTKELSNPSVQERIDLFSEGVYRFLIGFNKKMLLVSVLANISNEVFSTPFDNFSTALAWLGSLSFSLQLYYDFSGYSDMAIGLTKMFGYNCAENFNYPYLTKSISEFWRRWHISLGTWFRDYIYIPLGGSHNGTWSFIFNLFIVWILTGIWHGSSWNFIVWGLGYFILILIEKLNNIPERISSFFPILIYRLFTLIFINLGWVIFRSNNLESGIQFIQKMFIYKSNPVPDFRTLYLIKGNFMFIIMAVIFCFPVVTWVSSCLVQNSKCITIFDSIKAIITIALFIWAISFIVAGQNNPFIYANF